MAASFEVREQRIRQWAATGLNPQFPRRSSATVELAKPVERIVPATYAKPVAPIGDMAHPNRDGILPEGFIRRPFKRVSVHDAAYREELAGKLAADIDADIEASREARE